MLTHSARDLWQTTLGTLEIEVNRHNYDTWLKNTVGLSLVNSCLTVGVPSEFIANALQKRLAPLVLKALQTVAQEDLIIRYQVLQGRLDDQQSLPQVIEQPAPVKTRTRARTSMYGSALSPAYTFDSFIVGKSNRFAHAMAVAVAEHPGKAYNPLFLHSGVGLGKTHLLKAIAHTAAKRNLQCIYVSAEQFTNDFVTALRDNRAEEFRDRYRSTDILLMDDIQFIAGKEHSKESFFHTFNDLQSSGKQIVITSDSRPKSIPLMEDRLISRFEGGIIADIQFPDLETRIAILEAKATQNKTPLPREVAEYIAKRVLHNVRELEGVLNRLFAMSKMVNRPIDMELAQQAMADIPSAAPKRNTYSPTSIIVVVAQYYRMTPADLSGKSRTKEVARARQVASYLIREETSFSLADVGKLLGGRGHTTVLRAHEKIAGEIGLDSSLRQDLSEIHAQLQHRAIASG